MKKVNKLRLWIIVLITVIIAVALIVLNLYAQNRTVITVFLVIDFLVMTFTLQTAITASFNFKPKPKKYPTNSYEIEFNDLDKKFKDLGYTKRTSDFGFGYMKIVDNVAYKLTFIDNVEEYLKPVDEKKKEDKGFPGLKKCNKFIGFEVFLDYNDKVLERLPEFSFQGKNIFYEGFYYVSEEKLLIETNVVKPAEEFTLLVDNLRKDLGIKEN